MKKCISCGKAADSNNEMSCRYCGGDFYEVKTTMCNSCGATVDPDIDFCEQCGTRVGSVPDTPPVMHREEAYHRGRMRRERDNDSKILTIAVTVTAIVCMITTIVLCAVLFSNNDNTKQQAKSDTPSTNITPDNIEADNTETIIEEKYDKAPPVEKAPEKPEDYDTEPRSPYDYDPDSNDWYRLRKSKNDASSQVGAYKTLEKALYYASIYVPQGYTLYDKDFNPINLSRFGVDTEKPQNKETESNNTDSGSFKGNDVSTSGLYDYAPDSNDWYRLRKSKNDASSQVGAYKTVEKALYYADIYCPQGYTLYDKDFNVIR